MPKTELEQLKYSKRVLSNNRPIDEYTKEEKQKAWNYLCLKYKQYGTIDEDEIKMQIN